MRRIITATLLAGALTIPVIGGLADPAQAICFDADGREKVPPAPYQGSGVLNTSGTDQTDVVFPAEGDTVKMKARYENIDANLESGKVKITAVDNGTPDFRVRYFVGGKNITSLMESTGKTFKHIAPGESTKTLIVEVKAQAGSFGSQLDVYLDGILKGNSASCAADRVGLIADMD